MENKRTVSILIPYKIKDNEIFVHLQKKSKDAPRSPGLFGYWGGGMENGETADQALEREIKEELGIEIKNYTYFGKYDQEAIQNVYIMEVGNDFEKQITINEGDYGKWFSEKEALNEPKITDMAKIILNDFYKKLKNKIAD